MDATCTETIQAKGLSVGDRFAIMGVIVTVKMYTMIIQERCKFSLRMRIWESTVFSIRLCQLDVDVYKGIQLNVQDL